jgi:opacity protein-like surface antigen
MQRSLHIVASAMALLGAAAAAGAPAPPAPGAFDEHGVRIGFQLQGGGIATEDPPPNHNPENVYIDDGGGGIAFHLGYAFTPCFALQLAFGTLVHDTSVEGLEVAHSSLVLEAHYRFLPGQRARPYVFAGLGGTTLEARSDDYDSEVDGGMAAVGMGMHVFMTRHLLLDLAGRLDLMNWDRIRMRRERADGTTIQLDRPVDESGLALDLRFGILWQL